MGDVIDMEKIGVWQRQGNTIYLLESVDSPPPFHVRNRFSIHIQDQPYGAHEEESARIGDTIVMALNAMRKSDNG